MLIPLEGMEKETEMKLENAGALFTKGDRFSQACGLNKYWPQGRAVYYNHDMNFFVWINREDHLEIISLD